MSKKLLLRSCIQAIFVLALISFSGHVSARSFAKAEPTRVEIREKRLANFKRTIRLEKACHGFAYSSQPKDFTAYLMQYGCEVNVQFQNNIRRLPNKKLRVNRMTTYHSNDHSDAERG